MSRRLIVIMLAVLLIIFCLPLKVSAAEEKDNSEKEKNEPSVSASSCALLCVNNGEFLMKKASDKKMAMASTTKILTSLLALEQSSADNTVVTITKDMYAEGSSMYLKEGYKLTLKDLACGMMTVSGNDAANAVALTLADSIEDFAKLMNSKAQQIGMKNSSFATPSGLDDENHYSTAEDMAHLMEYAMANDAFADIASKKSIKVTFKNPEDTSITYSNHNRLLSLYEYCNGGKTGFTKKAGRCLVTSAEKDGIKLIAVTLSAPDDWNDHIKMYEYGFSQLEALTAEETDFSGEIPLVGSAENNVKVSTFSDTTIAVPAGQKDKIKKTVFMPRFLYAPVEKGQIVGRVVYTLNGKEIARCDISAESRCEYLPREENFFEAITGFFSRIFGG